jgi:hypothetical protein
VLILYMYTVAGPGFRGWVFKIFRASLETLEGIFIFPREISLFSLAKIEIL